MALCAPEMHLSLNIPINTWSLRFISTISWVFHNSITNYFWGNSLKILGILVLCKWVLMCGSSVTAVPCSHWGSHLTNTICQTTLIRCTCTELRSFWGHSVAEGPLLSPVSDNWGKAERNFLFGCSITRQIAEGNSSWCSSTSGSSGPLISQCWLSPLLVERADPFLPFPLLMVPGAYHCYSHIILLYAQRNLGVFLLSASIFQLL